MLIILAVSLKFIFGFHSITVTLNLIQGLIQQAVRFLQKQILNQVQNDNGGGRITSGKGKKKQKIFQVFLLSTRQIYLLTNGVYYSYTTEEGNEFNAVERKKKQKNGWAGRI
ncbi:MAG: hypothetical protein HAW58_01710 [Candidatus Thioglobus sp.]|nr:hypothetical protein [Candidatus Thioglobus sp.]